MATYDSLSAQEQQDYLYQLANNALLHWGITDPKLTLIKYRENAVFKVETLKQEIYALRVHRPNYHSDAALATELDWISALSRHNIHVPMVIPTTDGQSFAHARAYSDSLPRQVDLFEWVQGSQLGSVEEGLGDNTQEIEAIYNTIGRTAAQIHNQASQWQVGDSFSRHAWDNEGLVGESPFWGRFWELSSLSDSQKALMLTVREEIQRRLSEYDQQPQRYSMVHADLVPENILIDEGKVRILDFDDAGLGWHMFEIATALYFIQGEENYELAKSALIEGYQAHRELSEADLAMLPLFLAARGCTYLGWVQSRQETETAKELTPMLTSLACDTAKRFLAEA